MVVVVLVVDGKPTRENGRRRGFGMTWPSFGRGTAARQVPRLFLSFLSLGMMMMMTMIAMMMMMMQRVASA